MNNILVDTGFWYALFDKSDSHYNKAQEIANKLQYGKIIMPFPILYETLNTRFCKNKGWVSIFNTSYINVDTTRVISDDKYRVNALSQTIMFSNNGRALSLVDVIIREMLDDVNLNIKSLITFNPKDFDDVCRSKGIELINY